MKTENMEYSVESPDLPQMGPGMAALLKTMEDYLPTIPDVLTQEYIREAGFESVEPRIVRIVSVAAQKFISEIAIDALHYMKTRKPKRRRRSKKRKKRTLVTEDLSRALEDHGITVRKPPYIL